MTLHTRREFLASLGVTALGIAGINAAAACATVPARRKLGKIGLQLYTVRDLMQADMPGTLAKVAAAGYQEVEFAGYFGRTAAQVSALLAQNNLTSPSSHVGIDAFREGSGRCFCLQQGNGNEWITLPWIPEERRKTLDDWKHIATFSTVLPLRRDLVVFASPITTTISRSGRPAARVDSTSFSAGRIRSSSTSRWIFTGSSSAAVIRSTSSIAIRDASRWCT